MTTTPYVKKSKKGLYALIALLIAAVVAAVAFLGFGSDDDESSKKAAEANTVPQTINIVGFAVPEAANTAIAGEFNKTPEGQNVSFKTSYGPSGDQSRAVEGGLKADYVHFSVATDVTRLVDAGLVAEDWDKGENKGVVSTSIVVLGVREGNPKNIKGWDDLVKPGVEIVTANPASSGAARWNALGAWTHVTENGGTEEEATAFVDKLFGNVVSLTNSGRDATTSFLEGNGDVLLAYENEAILATQKGQGFDYVIPETTFKIENSGAILKDATPAAKDWLDFVLSKDGQEQFALKGFRPIDGYTLDDLGLKASDIKGAKDAKHPFPKVDHLVTLDDIGGWKAVKDKLFGDGKEGKPKGIITLAIEKSGKATQ